jgi:hypothetical protein
MPIPTYYFAYKNTDGSTVPITINDWATKTLTGTDLTSCQDALSRQAQFKSGLANYCKEYVFPYTSDNMRFIPGIPDYSQISESVIYRLYNFTDFIIEYAITHSAQKFGLDLSTIDPNILSRYKHTRKAQHLITFLQYYTGVKTYEPVHSLLKYDGSNVAELELDTNYGKMYPGIWDNPPVFPDMIWDKYWDMFLKDPNVTIVNPN